jgi:hypothetical protein
MLVIDVALSAALVLLSSLFLCPLKMKDDLMELKDFESSEERPAPGWTVKAVGGLILLCNGSGSIGLGIKRLSPSPSSDSSC